jgi:hypothetical protein
MSYKSDMRASFVALTLCAGCITVGGPPPYRVITPTATPWGGERCYVSPEAIVFGPQLVINGVSEEAYLAKLGEEQRTSLKSDLQQMSLGYIDQLLTVASMARHGKRAPLRFRPRVSKIELGTFAVGVPSQPTEVEMIVDVIDTRDQSVVEQLEMPMMVVSQAAGRFSSGQRLRDEGSMLGNRLARYLRDRAGCEQ